MSSLYASRWAATPPADETPQKDPPSRLYPQRGAEMSPPSETDQKHDEAGILASRWADVASPVDSARFEDEVRERLVDNKIASLEELSDVEARSIAPAHQKSAGLDEHEHDRGEAAEHVPKIPDEIANHNETYDPSFPGLHVSVAESEATHNTPDFLPNVTPLSPSKSRLEAPRLKKKVSWRGKTCVISIPSLNYSGSGVLRPLSRSELQVRLKQFEDAGYNTNGFDMGVSVDDEAGSVHAKPIYPAEGELRVSLDSKSVRVMLPDLAKWAEYMDHLTEQKLAALGVSAPQAEMAPGAGPTQDISRQSSAQYPPLPYSPPMPTGSAASSSRPPMTRGHSHAMSVVSPVSPLNATIGHAHRHSIFTGPFGFHQNQQSGLNGMSPQSQHPAFNPLHPGMQSISPQGQFAIPGFNRVAPPAQLVALRDDSMTARSGSPFGQQKLIPTVEDYSRAIATDQAGPQDRLNASAQQGQVQDAKAVHASYVHPPHDLPQLPEEDDEEELMEKAELESELESKPERAAYVPPHKRAELNANIAVPTPRGHRHNISEGLEREILEAENRQQSQARDYLVVEEESSGSSSDQKSATAKAAISPEKDPLSLGYVVQEATPSHKKSGSRFNVAAPSFNPGASFKPASTAFTFGANGPKVTGLASTAHNRRQSSGGFNVAAPEFKPMGLSSMPKSEFSFSANGPSFVPNMPAFGAPRQPAAPTPLGGSSIFGKVEIPDFVKPARRSNAVNIRRPSDTSSSSAQSDSEDEDEEGRPKQSEDRLKRARKVGDDGDEVPRFAEPTPASAAGYAIESQAVDRAQRVTLVNEEAHAGAADSEQGAAEDEPGTIDDAFDDDFDRAHGSREIQSEAAFQTHQLSSSLSALAKPFQPHTSTDVPQDVNQHVEEEDFSSDEMENELDEAEDQSRASHHSNEPDSEPAHLLHDRSSDDQGYRQDYLEPAGNDAEPSFAEIDAVMRQLNEVDEDDGIRDPLSISPLRSSEPPTMRGVTYLPGWDRSDAPSPSPRRRELAPEPPGDSSFTIHERTDSPEHDADLWPKVTRLNKAPEIPNSDWSADFSAQDDEKLHQRSNFLDSHIDNLIGRVLEKRLQPLEDSLQAIMSSIDRRPTSRDVMQKRSSSTVDSDADDEDELSGEQRQRPISRGKDKKGDQIKAAVAEALREQGSHDLAGRLDQALVGMFDEANLRRAAEEREAESRKALQLAEEEIRSLRDATRHHHAKTEAAARENDDLLRRVAAAEDAQSDLEEHVKTLEAESSATHATLEEYRASSSKWRQHIDQTASEREELDSQISDLQRQLQHQEEAGVRLQLVLKETERQRDEAERTITNLQHDLGESRQSGGGMKRRLEKLHSDLATAAGQLASEKSSWKSKEDEYRAKCDTLEAQIAAHLQSHLQLQDEMDGLRANAKKAAEARPVDEPIKASMASLEDTVRSLQAELAEQKLLAAKSKREYDDIREAEHVESLQVRACLQTDLEAANHRVTVARAEHEGELLKLKSELETAQTEAETTKARHARLVEEADGASKEALRKVNHDSSAALNEARQKHETSLRELRNAHDRELGHAVEDKQRAEHFLNERLTLSDAKVQHFQDRVLHLEERLEVAKSAAQAAAINAQSKGSTLATSKVASLPDKVSPQALRESILVLQEQLQERESQIERLQTQNDREASANLKARDDEIAWLRELLTVRGEELTDLVNTLALPTYDRNAVRDIAIRIRANLQMEQQEKERLGQSPQNLSEQAIASLSNFASPKAIQLTSAFNKWRSNMESSSLKHAPQSRGGRARSYTPSKAAHTTALPPNYRSGLMTPPASNLRNTPSPGPIASLGRPRLESPSTSQANTTSGAAGFPASSEAPTTPLFRSQSYDQDAEESEVHIRHFDQSLGDDDLQGTADHQPPAFRNLEAELQDASEEEGAA